jgi:hypothetical protein
MAAGASKNKVVALDLVEKQPVRFYVGGIKIEVQHYFQKYSGLSWRGKFPRG